MLWGSVLVVEFGFEIPGKNLVNFITRWFCGDKDKVCIPLRLVSIYGLKFGIDSNGEKVRGQVVSDMNLLMKHV